MKGRISIALAGLMIVAAVQAQASVFSSRGGSLRGVFDNLGYDYIDVADYQTNLNFNLRGAMEFELLNRGGFGGDLGFGVLETQNRWWGKRYRHEAVLGNRKGVGTSAIFESTNDRSDFGFFISRQNRTHPWRNRRFYSYSPYNRGGAVQALFYADPLHENTYLLAWEGLYTGGRRSARNYDDLVLKMTVHPAPEPATWVLLGTGLVGAGVFVRTRRRARSG